MSARFGIVLIGDDMQLPPIKSTGPSRAECLTRFEKNTVSYDELEARNGKFLDHSTISPLR